MTYDLFIELINKLSRWCNKTMNETQREVYWDAIQKIPDMAFEDIIGILIQETPPSGKLPTPDNISLAWFYWRQAHPDSVAREEHQQAWCNECEGEGVFSIWYQDYIIPKGQIPAGRDPNNYLSWYRTFVPCSQCGNWRRHFPTKGSSRPKLRYTRQQIEDKGWLLTDPAFEGNKLKAPVIIKDLDLLANKALRGME